MQSELNSVDVDLRPLHAQFRTGVPRISAAEHPVAAALMTATFPGPLALDICVYDDRIVGSWPLELNRKLPGSALTSHVEARLHACASLRGLPSATEAYVVLDAWICQGGYPTHVTEVIAVLARAVLLRLESLMSALGTSSWARVPYRLKLVDNVKNHDSRSTLMALGTELEARIQAARPLDGIELEVVLAGCSGSTAWLTPQPEAEVQGWALRA